jgi:hypothetical protein
MSPARPRRDRRDPGPRRAAATNGARPSRSFAAFSSDRSISYGCPPSEKCRAGGVAVVLVVAVVIAAAVLFAPSLLTWRNADPTPAPQAPPVVVVPAPSPGDDSTSIPPAPGARAGMIERVCHDAHVDSRGGSFALAGSREAIEANRSDVPGYDDELFGYGHGLTY